MHGSTLFQGSCLPPHFPDNGGMPRTLLRASGAADARSRLSPSALPAQGAPLLRGERRYSFRHIGSVHSIVDILAHPGAFRQVFCDSFPCLPLRGRCRTNARRKELPFLPSLCKGGCRTKRGGRVVRAGVMQTQRPVRLAFGDPPSRAAETAP